LLAVVFFVVVGVLVVAVSLAIARTGLARRRDGTEQRTSRFAAGLIGVVAGVLIALAGLGFREIPTGGVGIVVSFGQVQSNPLNPGLTWVTPLVNNVVVMDTRVQAYNFGGESGVEAFTKEQQPAYLFGVVNYHIDPAFAAELYQRVGIDYFDKVIRAQSDAELKQDARLYGVDEITAKRDELARSAQARLANDVAPYHITVDGIFISQVGLSPEYVQAVEAKQIALQNVQKAQADAEARRQAAQGEADAQVTLAKGQAESNAAVNASLTENLIRWQTIQKLSPNVQIMLLPSDKGFLFNIPLPSSSPTP
jgi:regulator of protease activity HflC (stomatin/prohibitin superfamily)